MKMKSLIEQKYIENNLLDNEQIIYKGEIHWWVFVPSIITGIFSPFFLFTELKLIGIILLAYSLSSAFKAFIYIYSTEFGITNKRVISKIGLISRETVELNHNKIESIQVEQNILGRMFNFGRIVLRGTGGGHSVIDMIKNPLEFKKNALNIIHQNDDKNI